MEKLYTAFISSTNALKKERGIITDTMLNYDIFPIRMENFGVSSSDGFNKIKELIDCSDIVFFLFGTDYGSENKDGISYTEAEYKYACESKKLMYVIFTKEAQELVNTKKSEVSEDNKRQWCFLKSLEDDKVMKVALTRKAGNNKEQIREKVLTFCTTYLNDNNNFGWIRNFSILNKYGIELNKKYFHVHISDNGTHMRIGELYFTSENNFKIKISGKNHKITGYNKNTDKFEMNDRYNTEWKGIYFYENNSETIIGTYEAERKQTEKINNKEFNAGLRKGIHNFKFINNEIYIISGTSHDAFMLNNDRPLKACEIFIFESEEKQMNFIKNSYSDYIKNLKKVK